MVGILDVCLAAPRVTVFILSRLPTGRPCARPPRQQGLRPGHAPVRGVPGSRPVARLLWGWWRLWARGPPPPSPPRASHGPRGPVPSPAALAPWLSAAALPQTVRFRGWGVAISGLTVGGFHKARLPARRTRRSRSAALGNWALRPGPGPRRGPGSAGIPGPACPGPARPGSREGSLAITTRRGAAASDSCAPQVFPEARTVLNVVSTLWSQLCGLLSGQSGPGLGTASAGQRLGPARGSGPSRALQEALLSGVARGPPPSPTGGTQSQSRPTSCPAWGRGSLSGLCELRRSWRLSQRPRSPVTHKGDVSPLSRLAPGVCPPPPRVVHPNHLGVVQVN